MTVPLRILAFAAVLGVVFTAAWAVGERTDPVVQETSASSDSGEHEAMGTGSDGGSDGGSEGGSGGHEEAAEVVGHVPGGLQVAEDGFRLALAEPVLEAGTREVAFTVLGPDGHAVTEYDVEHEKLMHLIVVRRDHTGFQHVHPTLDEASGRWSAPVELTPGQWRVFADFAPSGAEPLTLGADVLVPGPVAAPAPVQEARTATVDDYAVTVGGDLHAGDLSTLTLEVSRAGTPVDDLQPYLGAYGHLVALREGDLAYLHVHPMGEPGDGETEPGPQIEFGVAVPSAGRYHLYLDFQHDGVVRTAAFVLDATAAETGGEHQ